MRRQEREDERERVLPLGHPRDRLDADGMERERGRGEPRARERQPTQEAPEEERCARMEEDVDEVVAEGVEPPEELLDPERREDERVVLLVRVRVGPDRREPREAVERLVLGDVGRVVPDEAGAEGRDVGHDDRGHEEEAQGRRGLPLHARKLASRAASWHAPDRGRHARCWRLRGLQGRRAMLTLVLRRLVPAWKLLLAVAVVAGTVVPVDEALPEAASTARIHAGTLPPGGDGSNDMLDDDGLPGFAAELVPSVPVIAAPSAQAPVPAIAVTVRAAVRSPRAHLDRGPPSLPASV